MGIGGFFKSLMEGGKVDIASRFEILREAVSGTMSDFNMARDRKIIHSFPHVNRTQYGRE